MKKIELQNKIKLFAKRQICKPFFITTPIYYTNDKPHIGHFYTNSIADVLARWNRLKGYTVLFSTGTDDHGLKIQQAANHIKVSPKQLADSSSNNFKNLFLSADISFTNFTRTTEDVHKSTVRNVWNEIKSKGLFTKETYSGWYSSVDECFVSSSTTKRPSEQNAETVKIPKSLEWCEEVNWIFHIEKFKDQIRQWVDSGAIHPPSALPEIHALIKETNNISISRPARRVSWGIPVPEDDSQTIYVWFDALINYLTVSKLHKEPCWPPDIQIIGKDIIRFHTVLWPAILLALNMELPKKILVHSHWLSAGIKMSKSVGNVVDPELESLSLGGYEQLKYFLLSEDAIGSNSSYDTIRATQRINSHLVNVTGNLLSRISGSKINPLQKIGTKDEITVKMFSGPQFVDLFSKLSDLRGSFESNMNGLSLHLAVESIMDVLRQTNVFVDSQKPWLQSADHYTKDAVIYVSSESLRMCAILLQCFVPRLADKILTRLDVPTKNRTLSQVQFFAACPQIRKLKDTGADLVLLKRLEEK